MKIYFTEFAERKAKVLEYFNSISNTYILHLMCLKYFPECPARKHWMNEIESYFVNLPKLKGNKTIKYSQSYQNLWGRVEDSFIDRYEGWIHNLNHKEGTGIDYFSITEEEKKDVHDYIEKVTDWICTKLQSEHYIKPNELKTVLKEIDDGKIN